MSLFEDLLTGPAMGAVIALGGVATNMRFNKANSKEDRAAKQNEQLRDEVARLLAEEQTTVGLHSDLFYATHAQWLGRQADGQRSQDLTNAVFGAREPYIEHCRKLRQMAIKVTLYTSDQSIVGALDPFRDLAWNAPMNAAQSEDGTPALTEFERQAKAIKGMFAEVESATWLHLHPEQKKG